MPKNDFGRRPKPNPIRKAKMERYEKALIEIRDMKNMEGDPMDSFKCEARMRMIAGTALIE